VHVSALPREATGKLTAAALRRFALQALASPASPPGDASFDIAADHPAFAGHFPARPVLPGAALLALVLRAVEQRPALRLGPQPRIDNAKFLAPVGPGARLRVVLQARNAGVDFEVRHGETAVARGRLSAAAAP